jgi:hypothetical protein
MLFAQKPAPDPAFVVLFIAFFLAAAVVYFLPTGIALLRSHPNAAPIMLVNLLLGCTCLGWVVALVWSFTATEPTTIIVEHRRRRRRYDDDDE